MKKISFIKMNGAGNDFIIIDKNHNPDFLLNSEFIQNICDRRYGIGADGVITIKKSNSDIEHQNIWTDFDMEYFNADGSTGSLCGNGARCAIKFAYDFKLIDSTKTIFSSNGEIYKGEVVDDQFIKFFPKIPKDIKLNLKINAYNQVINSHFIDTGSPHIVIFIDEIFKNQNDLNSNFKNINDVPVVEIGREIRYSKMFEPNGTNVNFIQTDKDKIYIRTYERGVENETYACGTGSIASALILNFIKKINPPISLITKGKDELIVDFKMIDNEIKNLSLEGPAKINFAGEIII